MRSLLISTIISTVWLVFLFLGTAWPITIAGIWFAAAALRFTGCHFRRTVLIAGMLPTLLGVAVMSSAIIQQLRIDSASSCAIQRDASVMDSRTTVVPGHTGVRAVVRSELCDYGFAQGGVVDYVFVTSPRSSNREILALRYTSNGVAGDPYSMAKSPQVRWSLNNLHIVVPRGSIYALTYKKTRVAEVAIDYDMRPEEDDSSVMGQIWGAAVRASILDIFL